MYEIIIKPESGFIEIPDSITIINSIIYSLSLIDENKKEEFINLIKEQKIKISSMFPYDKKPLIPVPLTLKEVLISKKTNEIKKVKNYSFIKLNDLINEDRVKNLVDNLLEDDKELNKNYYIKDTQYFHSQERLSTKSRPYRYEVIYPATNLYFLIEGETNVVEELVIPAFKLIENFGLGKKKNNGKGQFRIEEIKKIKEIKSELNNNAKDFLLLSKLMPESLKEGISYQLKEIKGITSKGFHFGPVYLCIEGSVFSSEVKGKFIDDSIIKYSIFGNGFYIPIPSFRFDEEENKDECKTNN